MKNFLRSSLLILSLLLLSCGDSTSSVESQTPAGTDAETEVPEVLYTLPALDFEGEAVRIISTDYPTCSTLVTGETGDVLDDAKYQMQRTVEEALNVTLSEDVSTGHWDMSTHIQSLIMAGDTTFDIVSMMDYFAVPVAMENIFLPIDGVEGIHLEEVYWGNFRDQLKIGDAQYFAPVSCSLTGFRRAACMVMNLRLAGRYDIEIPYEEVRAGTWTWDDLLALEGIATEDVNGDGVFDGNDQFTFDTTDMRHLPISVWIGAGIDFVAPDAAGQLAVTVYDNEKFYDVFDRARNLVCTGNNNLLFACSSSTNIYSTGLFKNGRALLAFAQLRDLESLREMDDDFAILPVPKYDEAQADYRTYTYDLQYFCVPVTQNDIELSAAVIDALSCVGYYDLLPVYKETVLKDKFARDETSKEMLQLIFDTRVQNLGGVYLYNEFGDQFIFNDILESGKGIASTLEKQKKKMDKKLTSIMDAFSSMGD